VRALFKGTSCLPPPITTLHSCPCHTLSKDKLKLINDQHSKGELKWEEVWEGEWRRQVAVEQKDTQRKNIRETN